MLSQQIKNSGSLLDSVDAIRNGPALLLLLATFVVMALLLALGGLMAKVSMVFIGLFALLAYAVFFYGANAVGAMLMDEAHGKRSRPMMAAVFNSLATSHRLILVFLLIGLLYVVGLLALSIILFVCKIPVLGPLLYVAVFPVSVVLAGVALFALPTVIFPLSAPAIWNGAGTLQCVSQLLAIARKRLLMVLLLMIAVTLIAGAIGGLISAIFFSGTAVTALLSAPILGGGMMGGMGSGFGGMLGNMVGGGFGGGTGGHAMAAMVGGGVLFGVAFTLPGMVYLRGASTVYLRALDGLDLAVEQAVIDDKIEAARAKARDMQAQYARPAAATAAATVAAVTPAAAAVPTPTVAPTPAPTAAPTPAPTPPAAVVTLVCPQCQSPYLADDAFCGHCGHKLT
jgi:hypothetical protein